MSKKKTVVDKLLMATPEQAVALLDTAETGNISDRCWKKMQNKDFRKQVIKKFGRPEHIDVKYVSFMLTKEHALIEITGSKITHKVVNDMLNQYNLGNWTFLETRPEFQTVRYWFVNELVEDEELVVRSFYRTDREDAIAILKN